MEPVSTALPIMYDHVEVFFGVARIPSPLVGGSCGHPVP